MPDLKPCPFCGGKAEIVHHDFCGVNDTYGVKCSLCGAQTIQFFEVTRLAIETWNMRVNDETNRVDSATP